MQESIKKYVAEFIGTFVLVLMGCGTAAALGCKGSSIDAAYIATALAFGLSIVAMAYSIGNVSGCHVNPAVSLGVLLTGGMSVKDFVGYVIAQVLGAILGAAVIGVILGPTCGYGANGLYENNVGISLLVEVLLTFIFVLAILGVTSKTDNAHVAGLVIGLTLTLVHILGIHFTGTSVNPARSLGPALFAGGAALSNVWVFIVAPFAGGALAAVVWNFLGKEKAAA
jgi:aquaporin Z